MKAIINKFMLTDMLFNYVKKRCGVFLEEDSRMQKELVDKSAWREMYIQISGDIIRQDRLVLLFDLYYASPAVPQAVGLYFK